MTSENQLDSQTGSTLLDYFKLIPGIVTSFKDTPSAKVLPQTPAASTMNWTPIAIGAGVLVLLLVLFGLFRK